MSDRRRTIILIVGLGLGLAGCGDSGTGTDTSSTGAATDAGDEHAFAGLELRDYWVVKPSPALQHARLSTRRCSSVGRATDS